MNVKKLPKLDIAEGQINRPTKQQPGDNWVRGVVWSPSTQAASAFDTRPATWISEIHCHNLTRKYLGHSMVSCDVSNKNRTFSKSGKDKLVY